MSGHGWAVLGIVLGCWLILAALVGAGLGAIISNAEETELREQRRRLEDTQEWPAIRDENAA